MARDTLHPGVGAPNPGTVRLGIDMGRTAFGAVTPLDAATIIADLTEATAGRPEAWTLVHADTTRLEFEMPMAEWGAER